MGTEAACQYIVLVCVSLLPVYIRAAPPTTVTDACQNSGASLPSRQKQQPPCVDRVCGARRDSCGGRSLGRGGNAVIRYLCMDPDSPFYDPIHAQIARLYSCVNQIGGGGGSGCDIVYLTKAQRVSYHGN